MSLFLPEIDALYIGGMSPPTIEGTTNNVLKGITCSPDGVGTYASETEPLFMARGHRLVSNPNDPVNMGTEDTGESEGVDSWLVQDRADGAPVLFGVVTAGSFRIRPPDSAASAGDLRHGRSVFHSALRGATHTNVSALQKLHS